MAGENDQERSEPATPKKRQEARKKGQVAQSREIPSVAGFVSAGCLFLFCRKLDVRKTHRYSTPDLSAALLAGLQP